MSDELPGAGPELDAMVREVLLDGDRLGLENDWWAEHPSAKGGDAMWALEAWREQHEGTSWDLTYSHVVQRYGCSIQAGWRVFVGEAPTLHVAICHAILRASRGGCGVSAQGGSMSMSDEQDCKRCEGCGKLANDNERTPWTFWMNLPMKSAAAVMLGIVQPIDCDACGGTGKVKHDHND